MCGISVEGLSDEGLVLEVNALIIAADALPEAQEAKTGRFSCHGTCTQYSSSFEFIHTVGPNSIW